MQLRDYKDLSHQGAKAAAYASVPGDVAVKCQRHSHHGANTEFYCFFF